MPRLSILRSVLPALVLAAGAATASGQGGQAGAQPVVFELQQMPRSDRDPRNAALIYYKLWMDPPFIELSKACGDVFRSNDSAWFPDAALTKQLSDHDGLMAMVLRATQAPEADFGIEWSQGIGALLPHLSKCRGTARVLGSDARRCVAAGKLDDAAERVAAIYRLTRHSSTDGVLISGLVSVAINAVAVNQTEVLMNGGNLTIKGKELLLTEMKKTNAASDPFGIKGGIEGERRWTSQWLREYCTGPDAGRKLAAQILPLAGQEYDAEVSQKVLGFDEAAVNADLDKNDVYYTDTLAVWDAPDAAERLKEIESRLAAGEYGIIAKVLVPAIGKARQSDIKGRAQHAEVMRRLEGHAALQK